MLDTAPGTQTSSLKIDQHIVKTITSPVSLLSLDYETSRSVSLAWKCQYVTPLLQLTVGTTLHSLLL